MSTDKQPRKHTPEWKDSREARAARQAKRLSRLNAIAQAAGYDTWRKLETAALNGEVISLNTAEIDSTFNVLYLNYGMGHRPALTGE